MVNKINRRGFAWRLTALISTLFFSGGRKQDDRERVVVTVTINGQRRGTYLVEHPHTQYAKVRRIADGLADNVRYLGMTENGAQYTP